MECAEFVEFAEPVLHTFLTSLPEKRRNASVASITAMEIERFRKAEIQTRKTAVTVNFAIKVLRAVFNTARRRGITPMNPAEAVEFLPKETEERIPFTEDQVRSVLAVTDQEWHGMILLGYFCGLRLTDAANLTWTNVDLLHRVLRFRAKRPQIERKDWKRTLSFTCILR